MHDMNFLSYRKKNNSIVPSSSSQFGEEVMG